LAERRCCLEATLDTDNRARVFDEILGILCSCREIIFLRRVSVACVACCLKNEDLVNIYPFKLVNDSERGIFGSCSTYTVRRDVTDDVRNADSLLTLAHVHQRSTLYK